MKTAQQAIQQGIHNANVKLKAEGRPQVPENWNVLSRMCQIALAEANTDKKTEMLQGVYPYRED